jgi:hypothetical protein
LLGDERSSSKSSLTSHFPVTACTGRDSRNSQSERLPATWTPRMRNNWVRRKAGRLSAFARRRADAGLDAHGAGGAGGHRCSTSLPCQDRTLSTTVFDRGFSARPRREPCRSCPVEPHEALNSESMPPGHRTPLSCRGKAPDQAPTPGPKKLRAGHVAQRLSSAPGGTQVLIMGILSLPTSDSHTKYHWPPARSSDLLGGTVARLIRS